MEEFYLLVPMLSKSATFALCIAFAVAAWRATRHNFAVPNTSWCGRRQLASVARAVHAPQSIAELRKLVTELPSIKLIGAGHSWSAIAEPGVDRDLITLNALEEAYRKENNGSIIRKLDKEKGLALFGAGTRLHEAIDALWEAGWAFENLPSVKEQSLGGLIATGTHGTGVKHPNLAAKVTFYELMDGRGEMHQFRRGDADFAPIHLGALGVLTQVEFEVVPRTMLREQTSVLPLEEVLSNLDEILAQNEHVKFWAHLGGNGQTVLFRSNPTSEAPRGNRPRVLKDLDSYLLAALQFVSSFVPGGQRFVVNIATKFWPRVDRVVPSHDVFVIPHAIPRHVELEMAFPREHAAAALLDLHHAIKASDIEVGHISEVRFVKRDSLMMSNDFEQDSCHITALAAYRSREHVDRYFRFFENFFIERFGNQARAHWGKDFYNFKHAGHALPNFEAWKALRARLDPDNKFVNEFVRKLIEA